ncbi:MAG TPA: hypothetical protein VMF58_07355 [Rhizomicrobium sp.]|nr:hypothetical protein [Rhizomicrobium sp.]
MAKKQLLEDIRVEPTRFFRAPSDVLRDRRFSDHERLDILIAWDTFARASEGNADHQAQLDAIAAARNEVEGKLAVVKVNGAAVH